VLCKKVELNGHAGCEVGWCSDWKGFWMDHASKGCGSAGYNARTSGNPAGAWCCQSLNLSPPQPTIHTEAHSLVVPVRQDSPAPTPLLPSWAPTYNMSESSVVQLAMRGKVIFILPVCCVWRLLDEIHRAADLKLT
jgi:hypothetical protein